MASDENNNGALLSVKVLYWVSLQCVVGALDTGAVYHFWTRKAMAVGEAQMLARAVPYAPIRAFLCGSLRWDDQKGGYECESLTTARIDV